MADQLQHIRLTDLRADDAQPRREMDQAAFQALKDSMAQMGRTVQHITVSRQSDGSFLILSGHRRARAAAELGWEWLPAIVLEEVPEGLERLLRQVAENSARAALRPRDLCAAVERLQGGVPPDAMAAAAGVSLRTIYNYLGILEHPDLKAALYEGQSLRSILAEVTRRRAGPQDPAPTPSVARLRRSVQQLATAWPNLADQERRDLATTLRSLLSSLDE